MASTDGISNDLWEAIEPLLPPEPRRHHGGPPRVSHRAALGGILFILRHGLRWGDLPQELGYGSGVTCWRRLRHWQELGIWATLHQVVLNWLGDLDAVDWSRASVDSLSVRAQRGGEHTGPNPTDRGKAGSKYHIFLVDRQGVPLAVQLTAANVHDSKLLEPLVDALRFSQILSHTLFTRAVRERWWSWQCRSIFVKVEQLSLVAIDLGAIA